MIDVPARNLHVGLLIEAALRQHGLVEQAETGRDQTEQRCRPTEHPERRRAQCGAERQPVRRLVPVLGGRDSAVRAAADVTGATTNRPTATCPQAVRQPLTRTEVPTAVNAAAKNTLSSTGIDAHRHADAAIERLADGGDARNRQRALSEGARGEHQEKQRERPAGQTTHRPHDAPSEHRQRERRAAQADPIEHAAESAGKWPRRAAWPRD